MHTQKVNSEPTDKQVYDYIVDHLKREHGLADNRMGWMLASQAFLFAAFGAINSANFFGPTTTDKELLVQIAKLKGALNIAIPGVGLTVSIAVLLGVLGTNMAVRVYRKRWDAMPPGVRTRFPPTSGWGWPHGLGLFSTLMIPLVVCFAWLLVLSNLLSNKSNILLFAIGGTAVLLPYVMWDARRVNEVPVQLPWKEKEQMENDNPEERGKDTYERLFRERPEDLTGLRQFTITHLFANIWSREKQLSMRDRSMITVALLAAEGREDELKKHVKGALNQGISQEQIGEIMIHVSHYAGWPAGHSGERIALGVFTEELTDSLKTGEAEKRGDVS